MSREEAVEAYTAGRLPRRVFIRHLIAAGVAAAVAATYADVLAPDRSEALVQTAVQQDFYGDGPLSGLPNSAGTVDPLGRSSGLVDVAGEQAERGANAPTATPVEVDPHLTG